MGAPNSTAMLSISTTQLSATVRAFLDLYPSAIARLDGRVQRGSVDTWCSNAQLRATIDFSLTSNGVVLLDFHDSPRDIWAAWEALAVAGSAATTEGAAVPQLPGETFRSDSENAGLCLQYWARVEDLDARMRLKNAVSFRLDMAMDRWGGYARTW
jgi:hypothetical protein